MFALHGTGVGTGIAIGRAYVWRSRSNKIREYKIPQRQVVAETKRYKKAIDRTITALKTLKKLLPKDTPQEVAALIDAHKLMIDDPLLSRMPLQTIVNEQINAEAALERHGRQLQQVFESMDDPYLRSKHNDVSQIVQRIHEQLQGKESRLSEQSSVELDGRIVIINDLTPVDIVQMRKYQIRAFITNIGGPISHTAILARSMRTPAIIGLHNATRYLRTDDLLIVDGQRGVVLVDPDESILAHYRRRQEKILRRKQELESLVHAESTTLDGQRITLQANVELPEEIDQKETYYADGIGLYRTEFLFMNRDDLPDEDEQYLVYRWIVEQTKCPVTFRTLDVGADKQVKGSREEAPSSNNPALGLRAIRLCLSDPDLFKPQLKAIYRASAYGKARLLIPMLSSLEELDQLYQLVGEIKQELEQEGRTFDKDLQVGAMIEVPAAAMSADSLACKLDFLSIGTNDLIQYMLAIDRVDDEVNYLYDPLNPSVLNVIQSVIDAGKRAGIPVSMCGEMAGDPKYTRILLAMGLRDFSMEPDSLLEVKRQVRLSDISEYDERLKEIFSCEYTEDIKEILQKINV